MTVDGSHDTPSGGKAVYEAMESYDWANDADFQVSYYPSISASAFICLSVDIRLVSSQY
jgi:hypothetical protein